MPLIKIISKPAASREQQPLFEEKTGQDSSEGSSVPWLLTFADLMTILLVFSFVLFIITYKSGRPAEDAKNASESSSSLVSLADAKMVSTGTDVSIPVHVYNSVATAKQSPAEERIIMRKAIDFETNTSSLSATCKAHLRALAAFSEKNPSSKIVINADIATASKLLIKRATNIVNYLVRSCYIQKKRIFLQPFDLHPRPVMTAAYNTKPQSTIEVKLIKEFWHF